VLHLSARKPIEKGGEVMDSPAADFPHRCEECDQPIRLVFAPYATAFGQIISSDDYRSFTTDGLCSLCGNILADFAVYDTRQDWNI
jgi:hypothetical protein